MGRLRWSGVPWLDTVQDLRAYGPAETTVEHGATVTLGLLIPCPFGKDTTAVLNVTAKDWRNGDVTCSIGNVLRFDAGPVKRPAMDLDLLSNPRRVDDRYDDNGAEDKDG